VTGRLAPAFAFVIGVIACAFVPGRASAGFLAGYASTTSAAAGDTIGFHVSGDCPTVRLRFYRQATEPALVHEVDGLVPENVPVPDSAWINGCGWPTLYTLTVPPEWRSGMYYVEMVPSDGGENRFISFVVRQEGPPRSVLIVSAVNTYQAYNAFGGKSLYDYNSPGGRAPKVTFDRPYDSHAGLGQPQFETPFVRWFERAGFAADYATDVDIALRPEVLDGHRLLLVVGHNEYWSRSMYNTAQAFADSGGNIGVFGGNTCYWQARYESGGRTLVCYKSLDDPILQTQVDAVTVQWRAPLVRRPECVLFGVMYPNCAGTAEDSMLFAHPYAWITEGLEDQVGQRFGDRVVGYEYDTYIEDRSPAKAIRLFETPLDDGSGCPQVQCATYYERQPAFDVFGIGGGIFAAGSIQWSWGLDPSEAGTQPDPRMQLLTANVIRGLSEPLHVTREGVAIVRARVDGAYVTPNMPISCEPVHVGPDTTSLGAFPMLDDGQWPDSVANDDVYAGQFPLSVYDRLPLELHWWCASLQQVVSVRPHDWFRLGDTQFEDGFYVRTLDSLRVDAEVVGVPPSTAPKGFRLESAPNPFAARLTLSWGAGAAVHRLRVHDARGRLVATLPVARGAVAATWDGRDGAGHTAPAGVYWARAEGDLGTRTVRIVKLR
jgi:hypothetical protein